MHLSSGVVNEVVEVQGEQVPVQRFIEADVGMSFPKVELSERLFSDPTGTRAQTGLAWPEEYPFPPAAFRRQDESDDSDFYATPRFCCAAGSSRTCL